MFACPPVAPSLLAFLARTSVTFVVEELGVAALELFGDFESPPATVDEVESGDAVAELESFFFEDLFESFALDNCSCTLCLKPFILSEPLSPYLPQEQAACRDRCSALCW